MDWILTTTLFLSVLKAALCFNIDPVAWKTLTNPAEGFGYQVVQRRSDLLVSAPLTQYSQGGRGQIYKCSTTSCRELSFPSMPEFAVNMSLGLTMTSDPNTQNTMACGPTIPKDCQSITMYSGMCVQIDSSDAVRGPVPSSNKECRSADIAFLLDGSGSVSSEDFGTMKTFVTELIRSLLPLDTKFAIAQFSRSPYMHYYFDDFFSGTTSWEDKVSDISQQRGSTFTAKAIKSVVQNIFTSTRGSRPNVNKVLIVITDGASNDPQDLPSAVALADKAKITRFAIGVGRAFSTKKARDELDIIASSPTENVFQVENFDALDKIRQSLQAKLFAIEGSKSGESLKMEMAQEGFSAAYVPGGIQIATVGANLWRGGYQQYSMSNGRWTSSYEPNIEPDSYLGYSMAVAKTRQNTLTIVGAPRYKHRGLVIVVFPDFSSKMIEPYQWQIQSGEYFGAVVGVMDVDRDGYTDLILISAPMFMDTDREGRVYVCSLSGSNVECHLDTPSVLKGEASDKGRFGSSLAVLPDLNTDGFMDLAVGAPLENNGQGSIYIFHGEPGGTISSTYSQRIAGSEVQPGLKFFGMSISQSSFDHSMDNLPDLAVGSKGAVVFLRSKPIVMVEATVSFSPKQISTQNSDCSKPLENTAEICFTMSRHSTVAQAQARISFNLTLDATRKVPNNRAYHVSEKQREVDGSVTVDLRGPQCTTVMFSIKACSEDALNALSNELRFTFDGVPSAQNLSPSLAEQAQKTSRHLLGFEINCGMDDQCVDNLKVDFNFTRSSEVRVGIDELLDVTVSVENTEENSYNSHVILTYPAGLSYRKFTILKGRIECNSSDSEDGVTRGKTDCTVDKPILKNNTKASFIVSYGIETNSQLDRRIFVSANATSGNRFHSNSSEFYKIKGIDVKYSIFATIESSLSYNNFSFGKNDLQKPVQHSIVVTNDIRALNFTVVIRVPVKLGDKNIWVDSSSLKIADCQRDKDEEPADTDSFAKIQKNKVVDCSVARCAVFKCSRFMGRLESKEYKISANLSSRWIEQIGLQSAKYILTSTASLEYDRNQYVFSGSNNIPPVRKIEAEVEVYTEPDFTKEIVGGSLGGLALLALLTAGLYKAGFFKSKYKDMINQDAAEDPGVEGGEPAPE